MTYEFTHKLKKSVTFGTEEITEVKYNAPKGKQMRKMRLQPDGAPDQSSLVDIFAACSDQPPPFFDLIESADYLEFLSIVGNFIEGGHPTG